MAWGAAHEADSALKALGVSHLTTIGETLGEGIDICGRFFHKRDVWDHKDKLIPPPEELKAIRWEWSMDRPLGELLTRHGVRLLRQATEERP